jgi:hypothetical protein
MGVPTGPLSAMRCRWIDWISSSGQGLPGALGHLRARVVRCSHWIFTPHAATV